MQAHDAAVSGNISGMRGSREWSGCQTTCITAALCLSLNGLLTIVMETHRACGRNAIIFRSRMGGPPGSICGQMGIKQVQLGVFSSAQGSKYLVLHGTVDGQKFCQHYLLFSFGCHACCCRQAAPLLLLSVFLRCQVAVQ